NRNLRQLLQTRRAENGARLLDACRGNAHVEVVVECLADQRLQGWVLVNLPPSLIGEGLGRGGRLEAEGSRDLRLGPVVSGRRRAPSIAASTGGRPRSYASLANSTMRMAFFAARPISITRPICA